MAAILNFVIFDKNGKNLKVCTLICGNIMHSLVLKVETKIAVEYSLRIFRKFVINMIEAYKKPEKANIAHK